MWKVSMGSQKKKKTADKKWLWKLCTLTMYRNFLSNVHHGVHEFLWVKVKDIVESSVKSFHCDGIAIELSTEHSGISTESNLLLKGSEH